MTYEEAKRKYGIKQENNASDNPWTVRYEYIFAIDPDIEKSGACMLHVHDPQHPTAERTNIIAESLTFPSILEKLANIKRTGLTDRTLVVIEAGWLNQKSCYHSAQGLRAEKIAKDVGANHQTGRLIQQMAEAWHLNVRTIKPLTKFGSGKDRKHTHEDLAAYIPNMPRCNQDARDAVRIAWRIAGLPEDNNHQLLKQILYGKKD